MYAIFDTDLVLLHSCLLSLDGLSAQQRKYTAARILAGSPRIGKPSLFRPTAQIGGVSLNGHCVSVSVLPWLPLFSQVHLPMTPAPGTLNRRQLNAIVISCRLRNDLILRARTKQKTPIRNPSHLRGTPRPHRLELPLRIDNPSGRGAASWRPQPPGLACLSGPAAMASRRWMPHLCRQLPQRPVRTTGIYPGSRCAACAPRRPSSRRHRPKRP